MRNNFVAMLMCLSVFYSCTKSSVGSNDRKKIDSGDEHVASVSNIVSGNTQYLTFGGIGPSDVSGLDNIDNPERGFRTEYTMNISNLISPFDNTKNYQVNFSQKLLQDQNPFRYKNDILKLTQIYFYIDPALKGLTIPQNQIDNIKKILNEVKLAGFKAIVRFAYQPFNDDKITATCANGRFARNSEAPQIQVWHIQNHLQQLAPVFNEYVSVIHAVQAGFVGAWGEWHHDYYGHACVSVPFFRSV